MQHDLKDYYRLEKVLLAANSGLRKFPYFSKRFPIEGQRYYNIFTKILSLLNQLQISPEDYIRLFVVRYGKYETRPQHLMSSNVLARLKIHEQILSKEKSKGGQLKKDLLLIKDIVKATGSNPLIALNLSWNLLSEVTRDKYRHLRSLEIIHL